MKLQKTPSELRDAVVSLRPYFVRATWFSVCSGLLILAPSGYMLEVYDRVVNSRNYLTLTMLTLLVLGWAGRQWWARCCRFLWAGSTNETRSSLLWRPTAAPLQRSSTRTVHSEMPRSLNPWACCETSTSAGACQPNDAEQAQLHAPVSNPQ